jgi:hypothetical protein
MYDSSFRQATCGAVRSAHHDRPPLTALRVYREGGLPAVSTYAQARAGLPGYPKRGVEDVPARQASLPRRTLGPPYETSLMETLPVQVEVVVGSAPGNKWARGSVRPLPRTICAPGRPALCSGTRAAWEGNVRRAWPSGPTRSSHRSSPRGASDDEPAPAQVMGPMRSQHRVLRRPVGSGRAISLTHIRVVGPELRFGDVVSSRDQPAWGVKR